MYLIAGRKRWTLYSPRYLGAIFDIQNREFYDSRKPDDERFILEPLVERYQGEIGRGELLFSPAGWPHEVSISELSIGIGGSILNHYQIEESTRSWLWMRSLGAVKKEDLTAMPVN